MRHVLLVLSAITTLVSVFEKSIPMLIVGIIGLMLYAIGTYIYNKEEEREAKEMIQAWLKDMPTPRKRFTYVKKHKVQINEDDLHELLVYMSELEDYFERIGKL